MRNKLLTLCLPLLLSVWEPALAQPSNSDRPSQSQLTAIREAAVGSNYAYDFTGRLCNEVGPRLSGSTGAEAAVELVAEEMRKVGLKVTLQPVVVPHWVRGQESGSITSFPGQRKGIHHQLHLTALGGSSATPASGIEAEVVVVHSLGQLESLSRDRVVGRIVLFDVPFDDKLAKNGFAGRAYGQAVSSRSRGPALASKLGARAALVRSVGGVSYRLPHTGGTNFEGASPIPAGALSAEDADHLSYLSQRGPVRIQLILTPQNLPAVTSYNVIGDLPGSVDPAQYVIVSGHLDSWDLATGALDDAVGVAMALATAELFTRLHLQPRRTLRVVAWMNEENGLAGGTTYGKENPDAKKSHFAAIESDLGAGHPMGMEISADGDWTRRLEPAQLALASLGAGWLHPITGTGADISPLARQGVPCFHPLVDSRDYFDYHHTSADTFDKVNPINLRENCIVMAVYAWTLCEMP